MITEDKIIMWGTAAIVGLMIGALLITCGYYVISTLLVFHFMAWATYALYKTKRLP